MSYFDSSKMGNPTYEYVAWIDLMGTREAMRETIDKSANFIFKFHANALTCLASNTDIVLYPVMDGIYVTSTTKELFIDFLCHIFLECSKDFCSADVRFCYLIKGAIAFGPIYHGQNIPAEVNYLFSKHTNYKNSLLLGLPMIQAYLGEKLAPPFGLYIDESARSFAPTGQTPLGNRWYRWDKNKSIQHKGLGAITTFKDKMNQYFDYMEKHHVQNNYPLADIAKHREMFEDFFGE